MNEDGYIDAIDASLVLQIAALLKIDATSAQLAAANVNGDMSNGKPVIDAIDASLILQRAANLITKFPAET